MKAFRHLTFHRACVALRRLVRRYPPWLSAALLVLFVLAYRGVEHYRLDYYDVMVGNPWARHTETIEGTQQNWFQADPLVPMMLHMAGVRTSSAFRSLGLLLVVVVAFGIAWWLVRVHGTRGVLAAMVLFSTPFFTSYFGWIGSIDVYVVLFALAAISCRSRVAHGLVCFACAGVHSALFPLLLAFEFSRSRLDLARVATFVLCYAAGWACFRWLLVSLGIAGTTRVHFILDVMLQPKALRLTYSYFWTLLALTLGSAWPLFLWLCHRLRDRRELLRAWGLFLFSLLVAVLVIDTSRGFGFVFTLPLVLMMLRSDMERHFLGWACCLFALLFNVGVFYSGRVMLVGQFYNLWN